MTPTAGSGSGKEMVASLSDLAVQLDRLEEIMHALIAMVGDVDQQQQSFNIVLVCLEQGRTAPGANNQTPMALEAANGDAVGGQTSDDHSVVPPPHVEPQAPPPPHHYHFIQEDDQDDGDFLPT
jgi:hypothetical protein